MIYMASIAGRKSRNVMRPHHLSPTYNARRLIGNREAPLLLNANDNHYKHNTECRPQVSDLLHMMINGRKAVCRFPIGKISVNVTSQIFSLEKSTINVLHCHVTPKFIYWSELLRKCHRTCSCLIPKISIN